MSELFAKPMLVRLDRQTDRERPCCNNIAIIAPGKGPHAAELRCEHCWRHRGWMREEALSFVTDLTQRFGAPAEPIILRDSTIGDHVMENKQYDNSGILFRNEDKDPGNERDRDYQGSATINGTEFWLSAWIKTGKKGKFMSLSFKPKEASFGASKATQAKPDYDDQIPF